MANETETAISLYFLNYELYYQSIKVVCVKTVNKKVRSSLTLTKYLLCRGDEGKSN